MAAPAKDQKFYAMPPQVALDQLATTNQGLDSEEAQDRLKLGKNIIKRSKRTAKIKIFLYQLKSPLILILIGASFVTALLGDYKDTIFILIAVLVNAALGFYQENKAESALESLRTYIKRE